jgi:hypothetical protein
MKTRRTPTIVSAGLLGFVLTAGGVAIANPAGASVDSHHPADHSLQVKKHKKHKSPDTTTSPSGAGPSTGSTPGGGTSPGGGTPGSGSSTGGAGSPGGSAGSPIGGAPTTPGGGGAPTVPSLPK